MHSYSEPVKHVKYFNSHSCRIYTLVFVCVCVFFIRVPRYITIKDRHKCSTVNII